MTRHREDRKSVEVHRTYEIAEALCAKSYLDAHGVWSMIQNEHHIVMSSGLLSQALGGFRLLVSSEDAAEARELLKAADRGAVRLGDDFDESALVEEWSTLYRNG